MKRYVDSMNPTGGTQFGCGTGPDHDVAGSSVLGQFHEVLGGLAVSDMNPQPTASKQPVKPMEPQVYLQGGLKSKTKYFDIIYTVDYINTVPPMVDERVVCEEVAYT